jgi:hypothetical protein
MLRQFRFTDVMAKKLLNEHPAALIWYHCVYFSSVRALESKLLIARDRLKITINEDNVEFLAFKFGSNIRPRA